MKLYEKLADQISRQIQAGVLRPGERIPSVRKTMRSRTVSLATVLAAYRLLENRGEIRVASRSGYYVNENWAGLPRGPTISKPPRVSQVVGESDVVFEVLEATRERNLVQFGSAFIDPTLFPFPKLARFIGAAARDLDPESLVAHLPPGNPELCRGIARRYLDAGMNVRPEDIVITTGALDALHLCLKAVARPGDTIAIESPTFYAELQLIKLCGMKALELPTHPREGMDLSALADALVTQRIKACWLMTNFQNPLGSVMPEEKKKELVKLLARHEVPLIEDDVYEELYFSAEKPRPAKAFDRTGLVLHCSSFSKCLGPGYRVGWTAAGRFAKTVEREKWMTTLMTNMPGQAGIADYLKQGGYDYHLRALRRKLASQRDQMISALVRHFPADARFTCPDGGYFLWAELHKSVSALKVHALAMEKGISTAPGPIFSAQRHFENCLRLNYGSPWSPRLDNAIHTLGRIIASLQKDRGTSSH